ncbi:hypothetical protein P0Y35_01835 [Kiritimatiellaeota bacterium B1221]|nr:hypothetical protein [Kiritimatiellaeota bacterium B1221]
MKEVIIGFLVISSVMLLELLDASLLNVPLLFIFIPFAMAIVVPATYCNLRNRGEAEKETGHTDGYSMKQRIRDISRPVAVVLLVTIWSISRYRIPGEYSYRSRGVEPFSGSSLLRLKLDADGSGQIWRSEGNSGDFRVGFSWVSTADGIDITVPDYKHWSYSGFSSPGVHSFQRQGSGLTHVGRKEPGPLQSNGVKRSMARKRFQFKKNILQL